VLAFLPAPPSSPVPSTDSPRWRGLLMLSAVIGALATMQPWIRVRFDQLFGEHDGPPGWQSSAGFTCLCSCALVMVMTLAETSTRTTQQAVRPACTLLVAISTLAVGFEMWQGPGMFRGVTAMWTWAFWLAGAAIAALLVSCLVRGRTLLPARE
jgi:hypothetical protein